MSEAITTPSPDICVECGEALEQSVEEIGWSWGRGPFAMAKMKIHQWFRCSDQKEPLCENCARQPLAPARGNKEEG